jgi:hypothetical protein
MMVWFITARMTVIRMIVSRMTVILLNNFVIMLLPQTEVPISNSRFTMMVWFITARMAIRRMTVIKMTFGGMTICRKALCRMTLSMMSQYNESAK